MMLVVQTVSAMQRHARSWQAMQVPVAFVPTMGYLHEGHLSLIQRARESISHQVKIVVCIFVNPTQFAPHEDLAAYPHNFFNDKKLCARAGVDILFAPSNREMYPDGFSTFVVEERLAHGMEGAARPTHFRGVTTVLAKLFHIVQPNVAVFGAKDFQQAAVVRKMVADLNFPVKIVVGPTLREPNGLALSSRNKYLSSAQHRQAAVLWRAIQRARETVAAGSVAAAVLREELRALIAEQPRNKLKVDYIEFFDPQTLAPVEKVRRGTQMALAVFVGTTRLIDNATL